MPADSAHASKVSSEQPTHDGLALGLADGALEGIDGDALGDALGLALGVEGLADGASVITSHAMDTDPWPALTASLLSWSAPALKEPPPPPQLLYGLLLFEPPPPE